MSAPITPADRAAAHEIADEHDLCDWPSEDYHSASCRDVAQAIADAREAATANERSACVEWVRDAEGDGVANGLAAARMAK